MTDLYKALHLEYKSPSRKLIVGKLLNEMYKTIKSQIMNRLNVCNYLNFFTDKMINVRKKRVINFCFYVFFSSIFRDEIFHLKTMTRFAEKMNTTIQID